MLFFIPKIVDGLINRPSDPIEFCRKVRKELYDNGYECKMDEVWLLVKVSGHGIAIGFNENTYGKGVCILVRAYAPVHLHLLGSDFLVSHNMVIDYPGQALYTKRIKKVDDKK